MNSNNRITAERFWLVAWSKAATWDHFRNRRAHARRKLESARSRYQDSLEPAA